MYINRYGQILINRHQRCKLQAHMQTSGRAYCWTQTEAAVLMPSHRTRSHIRIILAAGFVRAVPEYTRQVVNLQAGPMRYFFPRCIDEHAGFGFSFFFSSVICTQTHTLWNVKPEASYTYLLPGSNSWHTLRFSGMTFVESISLECHFAIQYVKSCGILWHTIHDILWTAIGGCHRVPRLILNVKPNGDW